ncbi:MAG: VWA domain-containing protein, partial [Planctomycetes bacterium]|nr:VWA domain-containing protein [Planctomycetota bacterium]
TGAGTVQALLDTGSALTYCPAAAVRDRRPVRRARDFLPGFGEFEVDLYECDLRVAGLPLRVEAGVLPPLLGMALGLLAPDGWILGTALFRDRVVTIDLAAGTLHLGGLGAGDGAANAAPATACPGEAPAAAGEQNGIAYTLRTDATPEPSGAVRVHVALSLRGARADGSGMHPVDVAFVLDRSGSMAGEPLRAVQQAASTWIAGLPAGSRCGVLAYDREVTVLQDLSALGPGIIAGCEQAIRGLVPGGSTALAAGWLAGRRMLEAAPRTSAAARLARIVLMSDGRANVGECRPTVLAAWCGAAASQGITTTTVGFGPSYDEDLLRAMADAGDGSTWYVPGPEELEAVLTEERRAMGTVAALRTRVQVRPGGSRLVRVRGGIAPPEGPATGPSVLVGELSGAAERTLVFEFLLAPGT